VILHGDATDPQARDDHSQSHDPRAYIVKCPFMHTANDAQLARHGISSSSSPPCLNACRPIGKPEFDGLKQNRPK
jgi:hypothetical protein